MFDIVIPIGTCCESLFACQWFFSKEIMGPYSPFAWMGISLEDLYRLLETDFADVELAPDDIYVRFKNYHQTWSCHYTDKDDFKEKFQRRVDRFRETMKSSMKVLFVLKIHYYEKMSVMAFAFKKLLNKIKTDGNFTLLVVDESYPDNVKPRYSEDNLVIDTLVGNLGVLDYIDYYGVKQEILTHCDFRNYSHHTKEQWKRIFDNLLRDYIDLAI
jgi:hypothetical protein